MLYTSGVKSTVGMITSDEPNVDTPMIPLSGDPMTNPDEKVAPPEKSKLTAICAGNVILQSHQFCG
jgi:hypothetical protein